MTIYRYKKNGILYLIYKCSPRACLGSFFEAIPYNHNIFIGLQKGYKPFSKKGVSFKVNMSLNDFEKVAVA